ncbi:type VII secretion integral membrane protein EccD [Mycobacterium vicinigordonae]|uniref:Type VII secretion integral membrane protein EccD n=1 Tax=Mycobacterium vicinigordonae TaxID=1719132 RepID=A0A7D6EE02_9MYCO|nr:type VII secretion integral membrane protein EccD [Mycobacterium vicinigordonae]
MVSAAPKHIRVSVFGRRTQLDIALPLDVPVSGFVPELARLVSSRDIEQDGEGSAKDEHRTFWVLSRLDGDALQPHRTLRESGVTNGELLRLTSERALSPPILYDDVVDAVGRLNKAAYAAWNAASARWMAFVGVHLAALAMTYCVVGRPRAANHYVIVAVAGAVALTLVGGAAMAHRSYRLDDVAAALGWAAIPITAGIAFALLARFGQYGLAGACGAVVVLCVVYDRFIGTGHWAYLASALLFGLVGVALAVRGLQVRAEILFVAAAVTVVLACLTVRRLTARLDRFPTPSVALETNREDWDFENPFEPSAPAMSRDSGATMPTAEQVWTKAKSAAITRAALLAGLAGAATVYLTLLLRTAAVDWPVIAFVLAGAVVLGLHARDFRTWVERVALAVPAVAILLITCVAAEGGIQPMPVVALGVLLGVAIGAASTGLAGAGDGSSSATRTLLAYLQYLAVASLIPLALWVVGVYQRLGLR